MENNHIIILINKIDIALKSHRNQFSETEILELQRIRQSLIKLKDFNLDETINYDSDNLETLKKLVTTVYSLIRVIIDFPY